MFDSFWSTLDWVLGLRAEELTALQMVFRAALVYPIGILFIRVGDKRFIGKFTAFDVIMGILIGSILGRAITGSSPFFPTLAAAFALVLLHYGFASLSYHQDWFGNWVKGKSRTLVVDGEIQWKSMQRSNISERDLRGALREQSGIEDIAQVKLAKLERSGNISIVTMRD